MHLSKVIMASNMANAAKTTMIAMATISANTIKRLPQTAILEMKRPSSAFMVSKTFTTILTRSVSWSGRPESDLFSLFDQRINTYTS